MNKKELALAVAAHTDTDPKIVAKVLGGFQDVVFAAVASKQEVRMAGFFSAKLVQRAARMGRNPATGAAVKIKAKKVAKITPLKAFKDTAMGVVPAPKLVKATAAKKAAAETAKAPRAKASRTKAVTKAVPVKKAVAAKVPAKKAAATKAVATKAPAKKAPAKKAVATKAPAKKAPAKKAAATKAPAKKAPAKKAAAKK
jgi:DNA-binding protein HU-beta